MACEDRCIAIRVVILDIGPSWYFRGPSPLPFVDSAKEMFLLAMLP
jgi:hypothetical protein